MPILSWIFGKKAQESAAAAVSPRPAPTVTASTPPTVTGARPLSRQTPAQAVPTGPFRFVALDVETANSDGSSICQIGLACVREDGTVEVFSTLVDPEQPFSQFNVTLHGIGPDQVRGAPTFPAVLRRIESVLSRQLIIQHSTFDRSAIRQACQAYGLTEPAWRWADSVQIARRAWPEFIGAGGHGLAHLKTALGLEFEHHDAGEDAKAAALVVLRAEVQTGLSLGELVAPAKKRTTRKSPAKKAERPIAKPAITAGDLAPHIDALTALVTYLTETAPMSKADRDKLYRASSRRIVARMTETGETWGQASESPTFLNLPFHEFREYIQERDDDLGAQVATVDGACRTYFTTGEIPAPYYAWRVAIILSKGKMPDHERAFLAAWCRHFGDVTGGRYSSLVERARKRGISV